MQIVRTRARARARAHTHAIENQKEKLNRLKILTTLIYRSVREIPFGIDKPDGSHAQRTRKIKRDLQLLTITLPYCALPYRIPCAFKATLIGNYVLVDAPFDVSWTSARS